MSGTAEEHELLAAEYVLGTLDAEAARDVAARAAHEPALGAAIARWEERLAPLSALAPAVPPPPDAWDRLAAAIGAPATVPAQPGAAKPPLLGRVGFWRFTTAAGFALAAAFAGVAFLRPPQTGAVAALVPTNGTPAAFIAEMQRDGSLRLRPLDPVRVAANQDLELWALPPGASKPVSLGVIPAAGRRIAPTAPPEGGTQLLVSLEPRGGSPTGQPTGPVLFGGTLRSVD
ncbi:MAG: anti-sigma factor [Acetobacteraceae bacterium]|nr:anti-sigma factor [Acetobacteraceae bacterium]